MYEADALTELARLAQLDLHAAILTAGKVGLTVAARIEGHTLVVTRLQISDQHPLAHQLLRDGQAMLHRLAEINGLSIQAAY